MLWIIVRAVWQVQFTRQLGRAASLRMLLEPVIDGAFDGRETARRLRALEQKGIYVDTLLLPLLELSDRLAVSSRRD
jgi:hypothetical protein